ncbi:cellobiose PTS, EIIC [Lactiplantibacillus plantarum]|nr:cellobiose PTS, EIIC [Lactiplantibacillus plantarum]
MDDTNNKMFQFLNNHLMGPMGKLAQFRIVRAVMAAGMATIPFTIVGSMFLIVSVLPQSFPALAGFFAVSFDKITPLYMLANTATMGILSLYFCLVFLMVSLVLISSLIPWSRNDFSTVVSS